MSAARKSAQRGFLLIGVIMFVLALSILGLSLYSLSSYEAQFLRQSRDSNVALYRARGGLEMVKAILAQQPYTLISAKQAMGHEGVTLVTAYQLHTNGTIDTVGGIDFTDTVSVNVLVRQGSTSRYLHADYLPKRRKDYYKRLFTLGTPPQVQIVGGQTLLSRFQTIGLTGRTWLRVAASSDTNSWAPNLRMISNPHYENISDVVDAPDVAAYFIAHPPGAGALPGLDESDPQETDLSFQANPNSTTWYRTPRGPGAGVPTDPANDFSFYTLKNALITVMGTAIWELPAGVRFNNTLQIQGSGANPTLIIVAQRNGLDPGDENVGIWCFGGLDVDDKTTVILVCDDMVKMEYFNLGQEQGDARKLSVYSRNLFLMGPTTKDSDNHFNVAYDASTMDALIDGLEASGYLPQPAGAVINAFTFVKGSWRELKP